MRPLARLALVLSLLSLAGSVSAAGRVWTTGGARGSQVVAVDSTDSRTLFAAVPDSISTTRILRSDDAGASWHPAGVAVLSVSFIASGAPGIVYAGGYGEDFTAIPAIWKSADGGATWREARSAGFCRGLQFLAIDPADASVVYDGENVICHGFGGSLLVSSDGGATWESVSPPFPAGVFPEVEGFAVAPGDPRVLYLSQAGGWRSDDAGKSWTPIPAPGPAFAVDGASPALVYATDGNRVFRSLDAGETWEPTPLSATIAELLTDASVPDAVFARTATDVFASLDRGLTWQALPGLGRPIRDLAVGGGRIYAATDDGVFAFHDVRVAPVPAPGAATVRPGPPRPPGTVEKR